MRPQDMSADTGTLADPGCSKGSKELFQRVAVSGSTGSARSQSECAFMCHLRAHPLARRRCHTSLVLIDGYTEAARVSRRVAPLSPTRCSHV